MKLKIVDHSRLAGILLLTSVALIPYEVEGGALEILDSWYVNAVARDPLSDHLYCIGESMLEQRSREIKSISTAFEWNSRKNDINQILKSMIGSLPRRTPLNERYIGTVEKEYYSIEKVVYESVPDFFVTAAIYIPNELNKQVPAILFCSGHVKEGFRSSVYQEMILNYVRHGFVVLAFDPIGQGERLEYLDGTNGENAFKSPTVNHSYPSVQSSLIGESFAKRMIWDGIRGIDLLLTRSEVDPKRIGVTGRSGGGTQASYIGIFDERAQVSVIENYLTNFKRLMQTRGVQDAEQNLNRSIANHIDHADLLVARAPKPSLLIATTNDYFPIQGTRETFREALECYSTFGAEDNLKMVEDLAGHESTAANRMAALRFFQEHFSYFKLPLADRMFAPSESELRITPTGQVATSYDSESVFSLNERLLEGSVDKKRLKSSELVEAVVGISGFQNKENWNLDSVYAGGTVDLEVSIGKWILKGEGSYYMPILVFTPDIRVGRKVVLWLDPNGKSAAWGKVGRIRQLLNEGAVVVAPDLIGYGELLCESLENDDLDFVPEDIWFTPVLIGKSIPAIHASDLSGIVQWIRRSDSFLSAEGERPVIAVEANGEFSVASTLLAVVNEGVQELQLNDPLVSFENFARTKIFDKKYVPALIPGALEEFDLPDLLASLAPRKLTIRNPRDASGALVDMRSVFEAYELVMESYSTLGAPEALSLEITARR